MRYALLSVYDKTGVAAFAQSLVSSGWGILASGGTASALEKAGIPIEEIAAYTGAPEILGGRVKTLHPAVHGGILARGDPKSQAEIAALGYKPIDIVAVSLYPFEKTLADPDSSFADIVEQIDIGGVALLRAAAKNHERVAVLCDPADYSTVLTELLENGRVGDATRLRLAAKAIAHTAAYDSAIAGWLLSKSQPAALGDSAAVEMPLTLRGWKAGKLRYGENPHQSAEYYSYERGLGPLGGSVLQGKELSYNNILDLDAAWQAASRFSDPTVVVVKHLSPCGIAQHSGGAPDATAKALAKAIECDPLSAFGGVIACNRTFDAECAKGLGSLFVECIAAPGFDAEALEMLAAKKNLRLVIPGKGQPKNEIRTVLGGFLRQDVDSGDPEGTTLAVVSRRAPTETEYQDLAFAWKACISAKSNAIVLAKDGATVGIGSGQPNRVDSVRIAVRRATDRAKASVLASDAFFPFPDSVEEAARAGVTAIVHPGGSVRDAESIAAADAAGIAMVVTGVRHFRH
jgi:phosphoribosylaminoimidazolecarboxamide formyltransferase/IMP cyclohydrolase